jgi:omega-6 fatty acid desaturase (delta-12 desaturase)
MSLLETTLPVAAADSADPIAATPTIPTVKEIRSNFDEHARAKSTFKGVALFVISIIPYLLGYWGFVTLHGWPLKILSAALATIAIPMLFIIGHDACHQALTPRSWLNKLLGRLAMLPGWHAYAVWDYGHNSLHHGWTNVRTRDLVWTPLSRDEYAALSPVRRWMHRMYRTWWGVGPYYLIEMWMKFGMTQAKVKTARTNRLFWMDRLSVTAFAILQFALVIFVTDRTGLGANWWLVSLGLVMIGIIVPFVLWNWLMGFVVFQHHTHPRVPWYANEGDWNFYAGQIQSVVHVELPRPVELILHNIMEHTAHHVDPRIPLYNLEDCQKKLEQAYGGDLVVVPFTIGGYFHTLRTCRLFDYENYRWLDWTGQPTTEPLLERSDGGKLVRRQVS